MEALAGKIRKADAFVFVTGEYNWGPQPGLKNLTDHFLEEWFWRPAAVASYSAGRFSGVRSGTIWHSILSEMGMVVVSSTLAVGPISQTLDADGHPTGAAGEALETLVPAALPTTWRGGPRRRANSGRARRRLTESPQAFDPDIASNSRRRVSPCWSTGAFALQQGLLDADQRFADAPWMPAMPTLDALSERLRERPSFGETMPY